MFIWFRPKYKSALEEAIEVVDNLSQTIIDNRDPLRKGMPYWQWKEIAIKEIAIALKRAEDRHKEQWVVTKVAAIGMVTSVITISFWLSIYFFGRRILEWF